jgi:hypothetical protein
LTEEDVAKLLGIESFPPGWEFLPVRRHGELAGFFCFKGNEIHAYRIPSFAGRWLTRQDVEAVSGPLLKKYGVIRTTVRASNAEGHKFVRRLGFTPTHDADGLTHYATERLNHARH